MSVVLAGLLVSLTTLPVSVPLVPFSELTCETVTPGAAYAAGAPSASSIAVAATTFRPSMVCDPLELTARASRVRMGRL